MRKELTKLIPRKLKLKLKLLKWSIESKPLRIKNYKEVKKTIVVLGMHRSGTSLTSGILDKLGVNLGDSISNSAKDNPKGFYENVDFIKMNDKILSRLGGSWEQPPSHNKVLELKNDKKLINEINSLVLSKEDTVWGWKDPRTNLTIDLYLPFLKNPHFIICYRNPLAVAKSLNKRDKNYSIEFSLRLCSTYNQRLLKFLDKVSYPRLYVSFENFFTNPEEQVNKIKRFLDLNDKVDAKQALNLIDKKLKHF